MFLKSATLALLLLPAAAFAQRDTTRDALDRFEESLALRLEEGTGLVVKDLTPVIVVSTQSAFEETKAWYPTAALQTLIHVFGTQGLRSCEACRQPRLFMDDGRIEHNTADLGTSEILRLDEMARGKSAPAKTAVWLDETAEGVSFKVIDLRNSRILMAENFDPTLLEAARTRKNLSLAKELDRRARQDSITHAFVDITVLPHQHISFDWTEQWGDTNCNLSGFTISLIDPVIGIGGAYYRVLPFALNLMVGAKLIMSVPTGLIQAISPGNSFSLFDPLITGVFVARLPFGRSNFGLTLTISTNAKVGIGISLLNVSLLPFLP